MRGRIGLESAPGVGTAFEVAVPLPPAAEPDEAAFTPPDLTGMHALIVAPAAIEASLLARRLMHWGARTCVVPDAAIARALLPERAWDALFVDQALGRAACQELAAAPVPRRIVLVKPAARHDLPMLKEAGFTGYLVKPVRAASLAARLAAEEEGFDRDAEPASDAPRRTTAGGLPILVAEDNEINA